MSTERGTSGVLALLFPHVNPQNSEHRNMYSKIYPYLTNKLTLHQLRDLARGEYYGRYQIKTDTQGLQQIVPRTFNTLSQYMIKLLLGPQRLTPMQIVFIHKSTYVFMSSFCCFRPL